MAAQARIMVRAILIGFLSWLLPFAVSFVLFPLRKSNAALFTALMFLVLLITAGALLAWYFGRQPVTTGEATFVGLLWLLISLVCDYPMFAFGPMKMTAAEYYSEIGLVYLTFPIFSVMAAHFARR